MATSKTFTVGGVSTQNGVTKIRFANDFVSRFKNLAKAGHTDIRLIEFGDELTKAQICQVLLIHSDFQDESAQTAITQFVSRNHKELLKDVVTVSDTVEA